VNVVRHWTHTTTRRIKVNQTALLADVRMLVADFTGLEPVAIGLQDHLQSDLGLDSLNIVQLITELMRRNDLEVRIERLADLDRMTTVGGLVDTLLALADVMAETEPS
jgi:acyl carrier protein